MHHTYIWFGVNLAQLERRKESIQPGHATYLAEASVDTHNMKNVFLQHWIRQARKLGVVDDSPRNNLHVYPCYTHTESLSF